MKMINTIQNSLFPTAALPTPPQFERSRSNGRDASESAPRATGRFDIHDSEGYVPEIICRIMLGLCLGYTLVQCAIQLAAS
jgi:hypothetical protein